MTDPNGAVRLGIGSYTYAWAVGIPGHPPQNPMSPSDLVEAAARFGLPVVQICDNMPLHELADRDLSGLIGHASELGVTIQPGTRGTQPDHLAVYLDIARRSGSGILRIVPDTRSDKPSPDHIVARLRSVLPDCVACGVKLAIENHDRFDTNTILGILRDLNSESVGICLDTVNSFGALEGPEVVIDALMPYTINIHVKDFDILRHDSQMGFTIAGRPAGEGRLNLQRLFSLANAQDPVPDAILELWVPPGASTEATITKEAEWAARSVANLGALLAGDS